ncbi:MAG TPA: CheR family methyltransferase [Burkholderiaceae bacterium]|nr:CheR family methyltransferase [Burkholderiaceae bacterium]
MSAESPPRQLPESELVPSTLTFPVVGIGASAGGLTPLLKFFENVPSDSGMAFVVVVHLSPTHASSLPSLLQTSTSMKVVSAEQSMDIAPNTIYVIPPSKMLSMNDSYLRVTELDRPRGRHMAIDLFFRTLAVVHRERAFAIVMSGTGADGAVGITRIKEEGGISMVQQPTEAEFDGMPRAALATGTIDWVLPVEQMPAKLIELWDNAQTIELPNAKDEGVPALPSPHAARQAEEALRDILLLLRTRTGHDFRNYKRATVLRRLERRLQVHGLPNLPAYRAFLQAQPEEAQALLKDLLIGVTNFFRDAEGFEMLQREAIAPLFDTDEAPSDLRAWVAGCATGEEAYSVAILLCEQAAQLTQPPKIHISATDIDEAAITHARMGAYPTSIETDVSPTRLRRYFDRESDQYRIRKEVREKVMFAVHNLLHDPPFSKLDLISCRNLLIYLDRDVQADILEMFHFALKPGGYLFLGSSESADTPSQYFSVVDKKHRIYRANVMSRTTRYMHRIGAGTPSALVTQHVQARPEKRGPSFAELHRQLTEQYAPPSVLIDADGNIVHLSGQAGRFLRHAAGAPSTNLMTLVQPELRLELRTAVFQALRTDESVEARRVRIRQGDKDRYVNMIARPVHEPELSPEHLVLVLFDEVGDLTGSETVQVASDGRDPLIAQLEEELSRTREQIQNTIEQSETSTEELKASNEELQVLDEELRSTTEELETSKEELQSINEELITVNHELKTKVEETSKINDDLQNLIASTDIATVFVDRAMRIKRYTPHATRLFNLIPTDVGGSLLDITHKLDYDHLADDATEAFQSLRVIEREVASQHGRWYLARVLPYRTTEDRIDGAVLTFVDITGRRKAEETMRQIAEATRDFAIITLDESGRVKTWNEGAEKVFGYTDNEMIGQNVGLLFVPEDRESGVLDRELQRARDDGRAEDDRWHLRKDGQRVFCSGVTSPLRDDGRLVGYAKIARDITQSKLREYERERALQEESARRAEAQTASELKDEFLAVLSHELKNPLNLIQLNAEMLTRLPEARELPAVQRAAATIRRTVLGQAQIIDDLLDSSRINTGKLALNRGRVDLAAAAMGVVSALKDDARARKVELSGPEGQEPVFIDADPVRVDQIVWNLLTNALKFTSSGGKVEVRVTSKGRFGQLQVEDTGRGIDAQALPHVFEMFHQADALVSRARGGLGIGLAVVKQLVDLHGGRVEATSPGLGLGSTFVAWLPLADQEPMPAPEQGEAGQAGPLAGRRVLVVDADTAGADALAQLLREEGIEAERSASRDAALQRLREEHFDAVLADIAVSEGNGALLAELRQDERLSTLPVLALSALARPSDEQRAREAGFRALLAKPIAIEQLLAELAAALSEQSAR